MKLVTKIGECRPALPAPRTQHLSPALQYQRSGDHVVECLVALAEGGDEKSDEESEDRKEFCEVTSGSLGEGDRAAR